MYCSYYGVMVGVIVFIGDLWCWLFELGMFGIVHFWGLYFYWFAFHSTTEDEEMICVFVYLWDVFMVEGFYMVAAILFEIVVGINGIFVLLSGYFVGVCEICDEYGIMFIVDEVMAGFGRCGEWFVVDYWCVVFDFIMFVKGVNSGYFLFGGVVIFECVVVSFAE